jgi:hypothetical protein
VDIVLVDRSVRPRLGLAGGALLVAAALAVMTLAGPVSAHPGGAAVAPTLGAAQNLTYSQLAADLREGARTRTVPSNLEPPLALVGGDRPLIETDGCFVGPTGLVSRSGCIYGDTASNMVAVLFGDSHAAAWFPALDIISTQQHWRLVALAKAGCPAEEVNVMRGGRLNPTCAQWRRSAMQRIAALHPALVVVASSDYPHGSRPLAGVPTGYGGVWADGAAATFSFLRRSANHVVFISDIPRLKESAPECLAAHMSDVPQCGVARNASVLSPAFKAAEFEFARRAHIGAVDPTSWFCTRATCPVIVGNVLVYGDNQHMLPAWSSFLAPILAQTLDAVMKPATAN